MDNPEQVQVRAIEGEHTTVLQLRVHASDVGKLIGRQGRMATSTMLAAGWHEDAKGRHVRNPLRSGTSWFIRYPS